MEFPPLSGKSLARDGFNDFWGLPGKTGFLVADEGGCGGAFLSPYFRQGPFVLSRALLAAFTPGERLLVGGGLFRPGCTTRGRDTARGKKS